MRTGFESGSADGRTNARRIGRWVGFSVLALVAGVTGCNSFATVDAQRVGLKNTYGQISNTTYSPGGPYFINPFTTNMEEMDVGSVKWAAKTPTYTKDLQTADVTFTLVYHLNPSCAVDIRRQFGPGNAWRDVIVPPIIQSSIKNVFAQYDAMAAVAQRPQIKAEAEANKVRVVAEAISANPQIVEMRRIERWNGQICPEGSATCIIGGTQPLLNVTK
jgi:regulator of protease activity HflC (stomatin/prohibitin superfamily)